MLMRSPLGSVIIVNWNGKDYPKDCLESLRFQAFSAFEVVLVDNGSTDGSVEWIQENFPGWVRVLRNARNEGFSGGNNRGIRAALGKYIVLLNNDAQADSLCLEELVKVAEENPRAGMLACKIYPQGGPKIIDNVGHLIYRDGLNRGRGRLEVDRGQYEKIEEVFFPSGCAALYRREMLEEVGLFDEDFFAYWDDTELGFKGRLAGWRCLYVPKAVVHHRAAFQGLPGMWKKRKDFKRRTRMNEREIRSCFRRFGMTAREISWKD
ncbi:MAG: glycosyltransferase family 2 protein [Deltaproteobacteria bacterium]|nr:glycosyltransferase family 2 protein [Deltaproteobacteria bacterium]